MSYRVRRKLIKLPNEHQKYFEEYNKTVSSVRYWRKRVKEDNSLSQAKNSYKNYKLFGGKLAFKSIRKGESKNAC